jgi:hypothetical protein
MDFNKDVEHVYPDTEDGAREFVNDFYDMTDLEIVGFQPDPTVAGVWKVSFNKDRDSIIFMAGYKNPFGIIRTVNDACEVGDNW